MADMGREEHTACYLSIQKLDILQSNRTTIPSLMPLQDCQQGVTIIYDFTNCKYVYTPQPVTPVLASALTPRVNSKWPNDTEFSTSHRLLVVSVQHKKSRNIGWSQSAVPVLIIMDIVLWGSVSWISVQNSGYSTTFKWVISQTCQQTAVSIRTLI